MTEAHAAAVRSAGNSSLALSDGCNGLRTRSLTPRPVTVSNRPTVTPLSRAQLLHQVQTRRIRHHPPANSDSRSNGLAQSELRRIFCSDEGALVRVLTSQIASASFASFFCRFTNGFT